VEANNKELAEYMLLIKKLTHYKLKTQDPAYQSFAEDIVQETFLKLYKQDFFNNNKLDSEDDKKMIGAYIRINRRLTKAESISSGQKYENIKHELIEDVNENDIALPSVENPDQYVFVKEAYQWIKGCYTNLLTKINDTDRKTFFEAAFWQFNEYDMPLKTLAKHLGYDSSNPTQELKRFVEKVSMCTQPHGITINNPHEQIQFLREQIESAEVYS
jgi:hypothetical protein